MNKSDKPNIVIADDDQDLIHALTIRCSALGMHVHAAHDASSAWQQIEQVKPDVVVLDVEMPSGNGLCVSEMMSHHEKLKHTPVIMLTGRSDPNTIRRCHELMSYYVAKCDDIWPRIHPLLCEILEKEWRIPLPDEYEETVESDDSSGSILNLMDAVFASMGSEATEESEPNAPRIPWILSIDDDVEFAEGIKLRLEEYGVKVIRATAGMEGYRRAFTSPADLILLDFEMPNGNGDYVLNRLKDNPVTREIPVIVLTGRRDKSLERKMYALGANSYLTKPYNWSILWDEMRKYLPEAAIFPLELEELLSHTP